MQQQQGLLNARLCAAQAIHCVKGVVLFEFDGGVCGHRERCLIAWPAREQDEWWDEKERTENKEVEEEEEQEEQERGGERIYIIVVETLSNELFVI